MTFSFFGDRLLGIADVDPAIRRLSAALFEIRLLRENAASVVSQRVCAALRKLYVHGLSSQQPFSISRRIQKMLDLLAGLHFQAE